MSEIGRFKVKGITFKIYEKSVAGPGGLLFFARPITGRDIKAIKGTVEHAYSMGEKSIRNKIKDALGVER